MSFSLLSLISRSGANSGFSIPVSRSNLPKASSSKPHPDSSDSEDLRELIAASEAAAQGAPYVVPRKPVPRPKKKTPAPAPFMTESDEEEAEFNRARELALNEILGRDMALPGSAGNGVADEEEEDEEDEDGGMHLDDEGEKVTILVSMVFDPDLAQKVSKRAVDAFEKTITCEIGLVSHISPPLVLSTRRTPTNSFNLQTRINRSSNYVPTSPKSRISLRTTSS